MTARQLAFEVLLKMQRGAFSNLALDKALNNSNLDARDRALASTLVYGVTERRITLDNLLAPCLDKPVKKLKPDVHVILRMGVQQLFFMDKIPDGAAVNECVALARANGCSYACGLVNAVLRKVIKNGRVIAKTGDAVQDMSREYSCEEWIVRLFVNTFGEQDAAEILSRSLEKQPLTVRVNTLKTGSEKLITVLAAEGIEASVCGENMLEMQKTGSPLEKLESFRKGLFHVQGKASQICCAALDVRPGNTVLDMCAAPGGKSFTLAQRMNNCGVIKALDLYPHKTELIDDGALRLGINIIRTCVADAGQPHAGLAGADRILCDVPCSGLGVISNKPEIKYKDEKEIEGLPEIQYNILNTAAEYLARGGRLVYSTCTMNPAENEQVCNRFLAEHKDYICVDASKPCGERSPGEYVTLLPHRDGTDGFFFAAFEKAEEA